MRKMIALLFFMFFGFGLTAQTLNVKGVVKDINSGETLPGVSVVIKGTTIGTETDFDGIYNLSNVKKGSVLVFKYLGMKPKEAVVDSNEINVQAKTSTNKENFLKLEEFSLFFYILHITENQSDYSNTSLTFKITNLLLLEKHCTSHRIQDHYLRNGHKPQIHNSGNYQKEQHPFGTK